VAWVSVTQVSISAGTCRDGTDSYDMVVASTLTIAITSTGANGRDASLTEAANTWYAIWLMGDSTGVNNPVGLLHTSQSLPTLSGYNVGRRIGWVRNDNSSNFLQFYLDTAAGPLREYHYDTIEAATLQAVSNQGPLTFTTASLASFCPPTTRAGVILCTFYGITDGSFLQLRATGGSNSTSPWRVYAGVGGYYSAPAHAGQIVNFRLNTSQQLDYRVQNSGDACDIYVVGYVDFIAG
jgi:hypothetical protein